MPVFNRFAEAGRVVFIEYGNYKDKIAVITDIIDSGRIIVDGPFSITGVPRMVINFKSVRLTSLLIKGVQRGIKTHALTKLVTDFDLVNKYLETPEGKRQLARDSAASMNDFDRFKVGWSRAIIKRAVRAEVRRLKGLTKEEAQKSPEEDKDAKQKKVARLNKHRAILLDKLRDPGAICVRPRAQKGRTQKGPSRKLIYAASTSTGKPKKITLKN
ncbi:60S ribosomal protein L14-like [Schistocerca gregaria]|uniref:60S ribosomal protein L14-like n=1 Tax=Schistocerca gregaria TaxID=7010 RepID=UPI00211DC878|nr:60S ribosomal protein L14-like [Schistocerca gregaria]